MLFRSSADGVPVESVKEAFACSHEKPPLPTTEGGGVGNFKFYCQGNPAWANNCTLGQAGCGPTSMAMILTNFGVVKTPEQVDAEFRNNNFRTCGDTGSQMEGSNGVFKSTWLKDMGFEVGPNLVIDGKLDAEEAKKFIDKKYLIVGSSDRFRGQTNSVFSHIFVIQDVSTQDRTFVIRDRENCSYSTGEENKQNLVQPIISPKIPSWKYAYPIIKIR